MVTARSGTSSPGAAGGGAGFVVAEPVAYADGLRTLVQREVAGTPLQAILRGDGDPTPAVRAAARAVAALHRLHRLEVAVPPRPFANDLARLRGAQEVLCSARPDLAREVAETVAAVVAGLDGVAPGLVHGDLRPDHVLLDGDRVALIDFDLIAAADPVADVANVVGHLAKTRERAGTPRDRSGTVTRAFVDEYFAHAPAAWRPRLVLHRAMGAVTKAAGLYRRRVPGRQELIDGLLREAHTSVTETSR